MNRDASLEARLRHSGVRGCLHECVLLDSRCKFSWPIDGARVGVLVQDETAGKILNDSTDPLEAGEGEGYPVLLEFWVGRQRRSS